MWNNIGLLLVQPKRFCYIHPTLTKSYYKIRCTQLNLCLTVNAGAWEPLSKRRGPVSNTFSEAKPTIPYPSISLHCSILICY
jgi:hypothetical protein